MMDVPIGETTLAIEDDRVNGPIQKKIERYIGGERIIFDEEIDFSDLTPFQKRVLRAVRRIPYGETVTYAELAEHIGNPGAARAVGNACGTNPVPIIVPCHRVVAKNGMGGYTGGITAKQELLQLEGSL